MTDYAFLCKVKSDLELILSQIEVRFNVDAVTDPELSGASGLAYDIYQAAKYANTLACSCKKGVLPQ